MALLGRTRRLHFCEILSCAQTERMMDSCQRAPRTLAFRTARILTIASASPFTALNRQGNKTFSAAASTGKNFPVSRPNAGDLPWTITTIAKRRKRHESHLAAEHDHHGGGRSTDSNRREGADRRRNRSPAELVMAAATPVRAT